MQIYYRSTLPYWKYASKQTGEAGIFSIIIEYLFMLIIIRIYLAIEFRTFRGNESHSNRN